MNRIVHFELNSPDPEKSLPFFKEAFGWEFNAWGGPFEYFLAKTGDEGTPGIDGAVMRSQDGQARTVNIVQVEAIDAAIDQLKGLGGQCVVEEMAIPGVGYSAYFLDPAGVLFGIYEHDASAQG